MPIFVPRIAKNLDWPEAQDIAAEIKQVAAGPQGPTPEEKLAQAKDQLEVEGKTLVNAKRKLDLAQETGEIDQKMAKIAEVVSRQVVAETLSVVM